MVIIRQSTAVFLSALALAGLSYVLPVHAETKFMQDPCAYNREVISGLGGPRFSTPSVWDATYPRPERGVQFFSSLPQEDKTILSVGRTLDLKTGRPMELLFVQMNRRGRTVMEQTAKLQGNELPVKMLEAKGGVVVLSDLRRADGRPKQARLAFYTKGGALKNEQVFERGGYAIEATSIARVSEGKGFIVALHAVNPRNSRDEYSEVLRLNESGRVSWRRTYQPGAGNMLMDIVPAGDGFMAAGRIRTEDGRGAGWGMKLTSDGTIVWQRTYARGGFALLRKVMKVDGGFAMFGDSRPADGTPGAAWLMMVDDAGNPQWQRFYRRDGAAFVAAGLMDGKDGRMTLMVNARRMAGGKDDDHVRLLSVSPQGALLRDEAYIRGKTARASDLVSGWTGERIVTASIDAPEAVTSQAPRFRGWVLVATAPDPYADPCKGR
jgi:hypothetical protein